MSAQNCKKVTFFANTDHSFLVVTQSLDSAFESPPAHSGYLRLRRLLWTPLRSIIHWAALLWGGESILL